MHTLWIGNIPRGWNADIFRDFFAQYGTLVECFLGGASGTSSWDQWGKVSYWTLQEAEAAISLAHGLEIHWPPGREHATFHKLVVKHYDHNRAGNQSWESQAPEDQAQALALYARFGITGKGKGGKGKGKGYAIPSWLLFKGEDKGKAKGKGEDKGKGKDKGKEKGKTQNNPNDNPQGSETPPAQDPGAAPARPPPEEVN